MKTYTFVKHLGFAAITIGLLGVGSQVLASSAGTTGGLLLVTASTARISAMGGAGVALAGDPGGMLYNPASLAGVKLVNTYFTHQLGLASDYSEDFNITLPIEAAGVFGLTLIYHGMPTLNDAGGDVAGVDVNDKLGLVSYGGRADSLLPGLAYGANLKVLNSTIGDFSGNALAADLGLLWQFTTAGSLGLAIRNLGAPLQVGDTADVLPQRLVLGGKYTALHDPQEELFLVADVEQTLESETLFHVGGEYSYAGVFSVRMGYMHEPGANQGLTFGLGVQPQIGTYGFRFDYAYRIITWGDVMEGAQLFTVGMVF